MENVIKPLELLEIAYEKYGSYAEICRQSGLNKSTLRRIRKNDNEVRWHPKTIGKLAKAINKENYAPK